MVLTNVQTVTYSRVSVMPDPSPKQEVAFATDAAVPNLRVGAKESVTDDII